MGDAVPKSQWLCFGTPYNVMAISGALMWTRRDNNKSELHWAVPRSGIGWRYQQPVPYPWWRPTRLCSPRSAQLLRYTTCGECYEPSNQSSVKSLSFECLPLNSLLIIVILCFRSLVSSLRFRTKKKNTFPLKSNDGKNKRKI